ncbi:hypothetical protein pipiens_000259, partial [Culex pipiens pipiens]
VKNNRAPRNHRYTEREREKGKS